MPSAQSLGLPATFGPARLGRMFENGHDLSVCIDTLVQRASQINPDPGAVLDLSFLSQFGGDRGHGLSLQAQALSSRRAFETVYGDGSELTVLALLAPGDLTTNTPLDFLLEHSNVRLVTVYLDPSGDMPEDFILPDHDVAILAIGESPRTAPLLHRIAARCAQWPRPIINGQADNIARLTRDKVAAAFAGEAKILAPQTLRLSREHVAQAMHRYPITIRPIGTQAGNGLERVENKYDLAHYLSRHPDSEFYVAEFVEYVNNDGFYRKQRIVFIDRIPYISHLAISDNWIVHYMSADMFKNKNNRHEESEFMANFYDNFAMRHKDEFEIICNVIDLDYFGIDCGETRDGKLIIFEVDVAMIVHSMEDGNDFAYKKYHMSLLFSKFCEFMKNKSTNKRY